MLHVMFHDLMRLISLIVLFRMDEDQSARRVAQKYLKVVDADYYEFESKRNSQLSINKSTLI